MNQLQYVLKFSGHAEPKAGSPSVMKAATTAPGMAVETVIGNEGVHATSKTLPGASASFESEVTLTGENAFVESGTIRFGGGNLIRFSTIGQGYLAPSANPELQHGTVMWKIEGGEGKLSGASGLITPTLPRRKW